LKNESDSIFAALYITGAAGGWYYNASAGATINSYNFKRSTSVLGAANINAAGDAIGGNFRGQPDGNSFFASIETGYEWMHEGWAFGPYAGADYSTSNVDAYSDGPENTLSLHVDKQTIDSFTTRVGFRVNRTFNAAALSIQPEIHAEWIHEFEDGKRNITSALNISGAQRFAIAANPNTKDYANTGLAVSFLISRQVTLTAEYDCTLFVNDVDPAHQASVTLRVSF